MIIERPDHAKRLAHALLQDVQLYNRDKLQGGADVSAAVEEARALYQSRVAPSLHAVFDDTLAESPDLSRYAYGGALFPSAPANLDAPPLPPLAGPFAASKAEPARAPAASWPLVAGGLALIVAVLAFLLLRR